MIQYPEVTFLQLAEMQRKKIISDVKDKNVFLYEIFYQDGAIRQTMWEIYQLQWMISHFEKLDEKIQKMPKEEGKEVARTWAFYFQEMLREKDGMIAHKDFLNKKMEILRSIQDADYDWKEKLQEIRVTFLDDNARLKKRIEDLKQGKIES